MGRPDTSIWQYFTKGTKPDCKYLIGQCNYCGAEYLTNAKRMRTHILNCAYSPSEVKVEIMKLMQPSASNSDLSSSSQLNVDLNALAAAGSSPNNKIENSQPKYGWILNRMKRPIAATEKKRRLNAFKVPPSSKRTNSTLVQKKYLTVELRIKLAEEKRLKEEWDIKKQLFEAELKYKDEQIAQMRHERRRQETMFLLNEQEKKLKIDILKFELKKKLEI